MFPATLYLNNRTVCNHWMDISENRYNCWGMTSAGTFLDSLCSPSYNKMKCMKDNNWRDIHCHMNQNLNTKIFYVFFPEVSFTSCYNREKPRERMQSHAHKSHASTTAILVVSLLDGV